MPNTLTNDPPPGINARQNLKAGWDDGQLLVAILSAAPRVGIGALMAIAVFVGGWGVPILRRRIGWVFLVYHFASAFMFTTVVSAYMTLSIWYLPILVWWLALWGGLLANVIDAVACFRRRVHIHRGSMGEPWPLLLPVWRWLLGAEWSVSPLRVALTGEPLAFFAWSIVLLLSDAVLGSQGVKVPLGAMWWPLLTALGIWLFAASVAVRDRYRVMMLADQEIEQQQLAERLIDHPASQQSARESEGLVETVL